MNLIRTNRTRIFSATIMASATGIIASWAEAHTGQSSAHGFEHGFAHPFGGLDHALAMIAVGLWAWQLSTNAPNRDKRALWLVPASFVFLMALGGALGASGVKLPFVEAGIAVSILTMGVLVACAARLPLPASMALVGAFAVFHGHAHGAEMPAAASGLAYGIGFVFATIALHTAGIGLAALLQKAQQQSQHESRVFALRFAGAGVALFGLIMMPRLLGF